ncbi:MAG: CBS domain-containing protein [Desulfobulbaceae bacterium]|nr:CBS domain-containing protein [Desulfobulbaceae bacterium]
MKPDNALTVGYLVKHPDYAARVIEGLPYPMTADLFNRLSTDKYLAAFQELIPAHAACLLDALSEETRNELTKRVSNEKLATLLRYYDLPRRKEILAPLPPERRRNILSQMQFPANSVGSLMVSPSLSLPIDISVDAALKRIRKSRDYTFSDITVLDRELHYVGMVSLNKLLHAAPRTKLQSLVNYTISPLAARKSTKDVSDHPAWKHVRVLPVTDGRRMLIGILDYPTLVQHDTTMLSETATPQMTKQSSVLELFFQVVSGLIEAVVFRLFPSDKVKTKRGL